MTKEELIKTLEEYDKEVNKLFQENKKLKSRINKALKYIEDNVAVYGFGNKALPHWEFNDNNIQDLIKILKGEENDR